MLPLLIRFMIIMGQRGEELQVANTYNGSFYIPQDIQESYINLEKKVVKWRLEARKDQEPDGVALKIRKRLKGESLHERFVKKENNPLRYYGSELIKE